MGFARFMSSFAGRFLRIAAGIGLILVGLVMVQGAWGILLAMVGLVPLVAGIGNFCIFAPLFGGPLQAKAIPVKVENRQRY